MAWRKKAALVFGGRGAAKGEKFLVLTHLSVKATIDVLVRDPWPHASCL
jgi:hypothetical protein